LLAIVVAHFPTKWTVAVLVLPHHKRGVDLISDALPFGRLRYGEPNAIFFFPGLKLVEKGAKVYAEP
jgi:hypothetical protein